MSEKTALQSFEEFIDLINSHSESMVEEIQEFKTKHPAEDFALGDSIENALEEYAARIIEIQENLEEFIKEVENED